MSTFRACGLLVIAVLQATTAQASIITIDRTVGPANFTTFRRETDTLDPGPGTLYQDFLSVNVLPPPVTVNPGDTIQFHIRLQAPYAFRVAPGAGPQAGLEFTSNAPSAYTNLNMTGGPVTLDNPQNVSANPTRPLSGVFLPFSNPILSLTGGTSAANSSQPSFFNGFSGTLTLPNDFPSITFDHQVAFEAIGAMTAINPPPTLIQLVPEPATTATAMVLIAATMLPNRRRRVRLTTDTHRPVSMLYWRQ